MADWEKCVKILTTKQINKALDNEDLLYITKALVENKESVLNHDSNYACFFSSFVALTANFLHHGATNLQKSHFKNVAAALEILQEFAHARLEVFDVQCVIHQNNLVQLIYALCQNTKSMFLKSDVITFTAMLKTAKVPDIEKQSISKTSGNQRALEQMDLMFKMATTGKSIATSGLIQESDLIEENVAILKKLSAQYKLLAIFKNLPYLKRYINRVNDLQKGKSLMLPNAESTALIVKNGLGPLASNISAIQKVIQLPILADNLDDETCSMLHSLDLSCILAGVSVLRAMSFTDTKKENAPEEVNSSSSLSETQSSSNLTDVDYKIIATQIISAVVSIHQIIELTLSHRKLISPALIRILSTGLNSTLENLEVVNSTDEGNYPEIKKMDVNIINFNNILCHELLELLSEKKSGINMPLEEILGTSKDEKTNVIKHLVNSIYYCFMMIYENSQNLSSLVVPLSPKVVEKKKQNEAENQAEDDGTFVDEFEDLNMQSDEEFSSESDVEDGNSDSSNMFGAHFTHILQKIDKAAPDYKKAADPWIKPITSNKKPYLSPMEIGKMQIIGNVEIIDHFNNVINCLISFVSSKNEFLQEYIESKFDIKSLQKFVLMIRLIDEKNVLTSSDCCNLMKLMHEILMCSNVRDKFDQANKIEVCDLLFAKPKALSIAFQMLYRDQCIAQSEGKDCEKVVDVVFSLIDYYTSMSSVKNVPYSLKTDIPVEVVQMCVFLFHSLSKQQRSEFLCEVIKGLTESISTTQTPIATSRLLVILQYLMCHYTVPNPRLVEEIQWNLIGFHLHLSKLEGKNANEEFQTGKKLIYMFSREKMKVKGTLNILERNHTLSETCRQIFYLLTDQQDLDVDSAFFEELKQNKIDVQSVVKVIINCLEAGSEIIRKPEPIVEDSNLLDLNTVNIHKSSTTLNIGVVENKFVIYCFILAETILKVIIKNKKSCLPKFEPSLGHVFMELLQIKLGEDGDFENNIERLFSLLQSSLEKIFLAEEGQSVIADVTKYPSLLKLVVLDCLATFIHKILDKTFLKDMSSTNPYPPLECAEKLLPVLFKSLNHFGNLCRSYALVQSDIQPDFYQIYSTILSADTKILSKYIDSKDKPNLQGTLPVDLCKVTEGWNAKYRTVCTGESSKITADAIAKMYFEEFENSKGMFSLVNLLHLFGQSMFELASDLLTWLQSNVSENKSLYLTHTITMFTDSILSKYFDAFPGLNFFESFSKDKEFKHSVLYHILNKILEIWHNFNVMSNTDLEKNKNESNKLEIFAVDYINIFMALLQNEEISCVLSQFFRQTKIGELAEYKGIYRNGTLFLIDNFTTTNMQNQGQFLKVYVELFAEICSRFGGKNENQNIKIFAEDLNALSMPNSNLDMLVTLFTLPIRFDAHWFKMENLLTKIARMFSSSDSPIDHSLSLKILNAAKELIPKNMAKKSLTVVLNILVILAECNFGFGQFNFLVSALDWINLCREKMISAKIGDNEDGIANLKTVFEFLLSYIMNIFSAALGNEHSHMELSDTEDDPYLIEDVILNEQPQVEEDPNEIDPLWFKVCTYTITQKEFMNQHWYHCHTCNMVDGVGVCTICAKVCHKNHDLSYAKYGSFFCDCGAKEDKSCQAMQPREPRSTPTEASSSGSLLPVSTSSSITNHQPARITENNVTNPLPESKDAKIETPMTIDSSSEKYLKPQLAKASPKKMNFSLNISNSSKKITEYIYSKEGQTNVIALLLEIVKDMQETFYDKADVSASGPGLAIEAIEKLHTLSKSLKVVDDLMIPTLGSQEGAFENVKANFTGDQGQTIRQLIHARIIRRVGMCCMTSMYGKKHHLAVTHEKNKLTMLQLSSLLKEADAKKRKLTLTRLSTTTVPFNIVTMSSNPCNEEVLTVCGLKECHVLRFSQIGTTKDHLVLHPQLSTGNSISKSIWLPGSTCSLALITADFIKIYDLSKDILSPVFYFLLPTGKIRDATFIVPYQKSNSNTHLVAMSSLGYLYTQQLTENCSATNGPFYMTNVLSVTHESITEKNGQVAGGGVSVYYSHGLQLLFFSYHFQLNFAAALSDTLENLNNLFPIEYKPNNNSKTNGNGVCLFDWSEIPDHPGLITCFTHTATAPVVLMIEPYSIKLQEIKIVGTNATKAKMQDVIAIRHAGSLDVVDKTTLIVLCEDGSLRIFLANADNTKYWLQSDLQPKSIFDRLAYNQRIRQNKNNKAITSATVSKDTGSSVTDFPVDFFEHNQAINLTDIEFGGQELLYVYNKAQIKNRLNSNGMYIMSTKSFSIEITNKNKNQVITGIRVQLGNRGGDAAPTHLYIEERYVTLGGRLKRPRWFDFPLTREESIKFGSKITVTFGSSEHPDDYTIVDSIKVYGKTKEAFGWVDEESKHDAKQSDQGTVKSVDKNSDKGNASTMSSASELIHTAVDEISTHSDNVILTALVSLNCLLAGKSIDDIKSVYCNEVKDIASKLLIQSIPSSIHALVKKLLKQIFPVKKEYYKFKDHLVLENIFKVLMFSKEKSKHDESLSPQDILLPVDEFQRIIAEMATIATRRPENLCCAFSNVNSEESQQEQVLELMRIFFGLLDLKPQNKTLAPTGLPGITHIKATVRSLIDITFGFALLNSNMVLFVCDVWIKLLAKMDYLINFYTTSTLEKILCTQNEISKQSSGRRSSKSSAGSVTSSRSNSPQPTRSNSTVMAPAAMETNGDLTFLTTSQQEFVRRQQAESRNEANNDDDDDEDDDDDDEDDDDDDSDGDEFEDIDPRDMEIDHSLMAEGLGNMELGSPVLDREEQLIAMHEQENLQLQMQALNQEASQTVSSNFQNVENNNDLQASSSNQENSGQQQDNVEESQFQYGSDDQSMIDLAIALSLQDQGVLSVESNSTAEERDHCQVETGFASEENSKVTILSESEKDRENKIMQIRTVFLQKLVNNLANIVEMKDWENTIPYFHCIMMLTSYLDPLKSEHCILLQNIIDILLRSIQRLKQDNDAEEKDCLIPNEINIIIYQCITQLLLTENSEDISNHTLECENEEGKVTVSSEEPTKNDLYFHIAKLLESKGVIKTLFNDLEHLLNVFWEKHIAKDKSKASISENLLKTAHHGFLAFKSPLLNNMPCKVKGEDSSYPVRLTVVLLRFIYHLQKICNFDLSQSSINILHNYMIQVETSEVKKRARKLLLELCGSREKYREERDLHMLDMNMKSCIQACDWRNSGMLNNLPYKTLKVLVGRLSVCYSIAKKRTINWQQYCIGNPHCLNFLLDMSINIGEHIATTVLELLQCALGGSKKQSDETKLDNKKVTPTEEKSLSKDNAKVENSAEITSNAETLSKIVLVKFPEKSLLAFFHYFLLKENNTAIRWSTHQLVLTLFNNVSETLQNQLLSVLWKLWGSVALFGRKAAQFVDILGYLTLSIKIPEKDLMYYTETLIQALRKQNIFLGKHPNSMLYQQLSNYVNFDGYYLESNPCLVCNQPEVQFNSIKLASIKSETKYTTTQHIIKLIGSYTIQKVTVKLTDVKRTKMIRKAILSYNNKKVPAIVELKNKKSLWNKAKSVVLNQGQTEIKFELPLPVVATNLMLEFAEFYENVSVTTETLQCPRCSASVQASPGICGNCGENVFQCHKCRSINYDEKDPYLCNVCGFSKYGKFDIALSAKPCCAVDTIENDEDREKTVFDVSSLLVKADSLYNQLVVRKPELEDLLLKTSKLSTLYSSGKPNESTMNNNSTSSRVPVLNQNTQAIALGGGSSAVIGSSSVNKHIMLLAQKYCQDVKSTFEQLSKIMRTVLASRKEILKYDAKQKVVNNIIDSENAHETKFDLTSTSDSCQSAPNCYGCAFSTAQHCLNLLRAFANNKQACERLVQENIIPDLVEMNLRRGNAAQRQKVQKLICLIVKNNANATTQLNNLLLDHIKSSIKHSHRNLIPAAVATEMHMLVASVNIHDSCWEIRLRSIIYLFQLSIKLSSPSVIENITLPCIEILKSKIAVSLNEAEKTKLVKSAQHNNRLLLDIKAWMEGNPSQSFEQWKKNKCLVMFIGENMNEMSKEEIHKVYIMEKYARKWQKFVIGKRMQQNKIGFTSLKHDWLKQILFCKSSMAVRKAACAIVSSLAENPSRKAQIIELLTSYLSEVSLGGEIAFEAYCMYEDLISNKQWKVFLVAKGILPYLGDLIKKEIDHLLAMEASTLTLDLQQGYALKYLTELLSELVHVPYVQQHYKRKLVSTILNSYLNLRKLMIPRTIIVDDAQENLLDLLEDMTTGTEAETRAFMAVCIDTIKKHDLSDFKTPLFIFERLANIIVPETNNSNEFFLSLEKDPLQEDFLQGRMVGNPYPSTEPGLGPLMRDVKNKICRDCDLIALLEDDNGMELLVNNKIISLDLSVRDVYNKVWVPTQVDDEPMRVVYRMRGLLGEATEDMVERLDTDEDNRDEEEVYKLASVLSENGGLEVMLERLEVIKNLKGGRQIVDIIMKVLSYAVHLRQNRKYLMKPELNMLNVLLGTLNLGLQAGEDGVKLVEQLLQVMDRVLQEAAADDKKEVLKGDKNKLMLLLQQIDSETVQSHTNVLRGLMGIIPFLSFGDKDLMQMLIDHFSTALDFDQFDKNHSARDTLYLECFCEISSSIRNNTSGFQLKELIMKNKIVENTLSYISQDAPQHKNFEAEDWKQFLAKPALPYVLRLLAGLCKNHAPTQLAVSANQKTINDLHRLEQVSTQESIGSLAENVLEVLKEHEEVEKIVQTVRRDTKAEKKRLAMEVRLKQLGALGMKTNDKGQVVTQSPILKQIGDLVEESGLTCIICREGYKFEPKKVLGIYTYTRRCPLEEFENSSRKLQGYSTVSHFNIVHYDCHTSAVRAARGREEWDSAMLQNANTKCNGLLPLWGPVVPESAFATCLARHNTYLQEATAYKEPNVHSTVHDLKLLLFRFANEKSFSEDAGGGGRQSNVQLLPYMIHMAQYVINTTRSYSREETTLNNFLQVDTSIWVESSYAVDGPLFCSALFLFIFDHKKWKTSRLQCLKRLLVVAQARKQSKTTIKTLTNVEIQEYSVYKPFLMFWTLIDLAYKELFKKVGPSDDDTKNWSVRLSEYIRQHDSELIENSEKFLNSYQEEFLVIDTLDEFMDASGLLEEVGSNITEFLKSIFVSVS